MTNYYYYYQISLWLVVVVIIPQAAAIFPIMPESHELIVSTPGMPQQQIYFTRIS